MPRPRQVKATGKDDEGDITSLKGGFGDVPIAQAIRDIEQGKAPNVPLRPGDLISVPERIF